MGRATISGVLYLKHMEAHGPLAASYTTRLWQSWVHPLLAAAETIFSILANSITEKQTQSLQDYHSIEASVMLQYNTKSY